MPLAFTQQDFLGLVLVSGKNGNTKFGGLLSNFLCFLGPFSHFIWALSVIIFAISLFFITVKKVVTKIYIKGVSSVEYKTGK